MNEPITIEKEEFWPVYTLDTNSSWGESAFRHISRVPQELVDRYYASMKEFNAVQEELKRLF